VDRLHNLAAIESDGDFDVAILGGGVNGACLYDALCRRGYRTLLLDHGDFASGTSQASGMMIWGGLLYLRNFDLPSVFQLSRDRDRMARAMASRMSVSVMRYLPSAGGSWSRKRVQAALWLYWMMSLGNRRMPSFEPSFDELELVKPDLINGSLLFEEVLLNSSDARFVLSWIAPHRLRGQVAVNYCSAEGAYDRSDKRWHLDLTDKLTGKPYSATARVVVNCAGVWTDDVNASFGIESPFRHALSKGVYLVTPRPPQHQTSLFFELNEESDVITFVPWGPVSLWGPTETFVGDIAEGLKANASDVEYLLDHYERRLRHPLSREDIISVRCGIRPLVVDRQFVNDGNPLDLSRRQEVFQDSDRPWIACYGGKLTGCERMAARVVKLVRKMVAPGGETGAADDDWERDVETVMFPGLSQAMPSAAWCARREMCCTLEDYVRRRTNIGQWVPRLGLGRHDENAPLLRQAALEIAGGDAVLAARLFVQCQDKVLREIDPLLTTPVLAEHAIEGGR
jgi:glycerol-3-phosphate dehydrogenase